MGNDGLRGAGWSAPAGRYSSMCGGVGEGIGGSTAGGADRHRDFKKGCAREAGVVGCGGALERWEVPERENPLRSAEGVAGALARSQADLLNPDQRGWEPRAGRGPA